MWSCLYQRLPFPFQIVKLRGVCKLQKVQVPDSSARPSGALIASDDLDTYAWFGSRKEWHHDPTKRTGSLPSIIRGVIT